MLQPLQGLLEILQRNIDKVIGQSFMTKVSQSKSRVAMGGEQGRLIFTDRGVGTAKNQHAGIGARTYRVAKSSDQPMFAYRHTDNVRSTKQHLDARRTHELPIDFG